MQYPRLSPSGALDFRFEQDGLVHENRDNFIAMAVSYCLRSYDQDSAEDHVVALLQQQMELSRTHKGRWNFDDEGQLRRFVARKISSTLRNASWRAGARPRAPIPGVLPDRWLELGEEQILPSGRSVRPVISIPPNPLPLDWAEEILADALDNFFEEVPLFNSIGVNDLTAQQMIAAHRAAGPTVAAPQPRLLLAASPGLGKTRGALQRLAARFTRAREIDGDDYVRMNVIYACPTVELAQQNAETYRSFGGHCTVSLGRDHNFDKDPEGTPCKIPEVVRAVQRSGYSGSIQSSLCRQYDPRTGFTDYCEHFHDCAYQRQFDPNADVHFVAHSHLTHVMSEAHYGRIELLIIDESFLGHQVTKKKLIAPHALAHDTYGQIVIQSMKDGVNPWHAFRDAGITIKMIESRISLLDMRNQREQPPVYPNMSAKKALKAFHPEKGWRSDPLISVLRRIRDEYKVARQGSEPIRCLAFNPEHPVVDRSGAATTAPMLYLQYRSSFKMLRKDMPVLLLDATGHSEILAELHIPRIKFRRIEVDRQANVLQATGFTGSMSKMKGENSLYRDEAMRVAARFATTAPKLLIGTTKGAIEKGLKPPNDASAVAHYGGIRGLNKYEGFDAVVIAGRQQMNIHDLENMARALLYDDPRPLNLTGSYATRVSGYYMRCTTEDWTHYHRERRAGRPVDKPSLWGVNVACHVDPFIEALRFQVTEAEIIQMIDRPRWARRPDGYFRGQIIVLTEIPIDGLPVDVLLPYKELVGRPRPGVRLKEAYERLGALPPPSMLMELAPGVWPSIKSIEQEMRLVVDICALLSAGCWQFRVPGRRGRHSRIYAQSRDVAVRFLRKHCPEAGII